MTRVWHVAVSGSDLGDGSEAKPFRTINRAATHACPGDRVVVHEGVYREWVKPRRGGLSDKRRITYEAAQNENVVIKGSERVDVWEHVDGTVWKVDIPASMFGDFNPFDEQVSGDWLLHQDKRIPRKHLGDVYLNGMSFFEVGDRASLADPPQRTQVLDHRTGLPDEVRNTEQTRYVWFAEVAETHTTIWANFQGSDPNAELVEINVRPTVFYPLIHHVDFITVRGFELAQAATPWAPPTAEQVGLIGPNWAKGWIIEDNVIHDAKCSGISIGKERSTGHNYSTERGDKSGYQYQLEAVFAARRRGWDSEQIGSHVIRRNAIFDCGQGGVVGHLGCVFSTITQNHIYNIGLKREFYGAEIAGIKLHAAIDVVLAENRIHDCSLGTWLDWQTQGTHLSRSVYWNNNRDLYIEVSHGPYLVQHNIFASRASIENFSQGGAYVNNLILGAVVLEPVVDRPTPYHVPHSTEVAGYAAIMGGDDRWVGNVFVGGDLSGAFGEDRAVFGVERWAGYGTAGYDGHPTSLAEFQRQVKRQPGGEHEQFASTKQPVYVRDNVYLMGAEPYEGESGARVLGGHAEFSVVRDGESLYLQCELPDDFSLCELGVVTGDALERVRVVDVGFEDHDGGEVVLDRDLLGERKVGHEKHPAGPLVSLRGGSGRLQLW